ncbi:C45 family autoproteolytic acyltransferase/hydrolase [Paenibacillus solisilvae]|uniref:C45 family autoproteolytic acyltransferase/hydrolase n=1 Tax=Paenibacillus solisilvae TaxID=2486751 RepID=A0ABW0W6K0_9BACL
MLHISLSGTPRERGLVHGESYRKQIHELLELAKSKFLHSIKLDEANVFLDRMFLYTKLHEPELVEEMESIGKAASVDLQDIFLLHAVSALSSFGPNCTNITVQDSADGPLLGKTSDIGEDYSYYMLQQTTTHDGQRFIAAGWVGTVWMEVGMNHHGFVVGQSSGPIAPEQDGSGLPTLLCPRPLLTRCRNVPEAIAYLQDRRMAGRGLNMMLLDREGNNAVVEKSGSYQSVRAATDEILFCTNHFLSQEMKDFRGLGMPGIEENSRSRFSYLLNTASTKPAVSLNQRQLQELLRSHEGHICQHDDPDLTTHYAFIAAPRQLEFMVTEGNPCENEFLSYRL